MFKDCYLILTYCTQKALWRLSFLSIVGLALLPCFAAAQSERPHAVGLRVSMLSNWDEFENDPIPSFDLSYRLPLRRHWSVEVTAGLARGRAFDDIRTGVSGPVRSRSIQGAVTVQRAWALRNPQWVVYAGAGVGFRDYRLSRVNESAAGATLRRGTNLTLQGVAGVRYSFKRAPVELDLGFRPQYAGEGFGVDLRPSVGLRYRFGGR